MKTRRYYRQLFGNGVPTLEQWDALSESSRTWWRRQTRHQPFIEPVRTPARGTHAELLAIAAEDRQRPTCPKAHKAGRVRIATQVRAHRAFARLP